MKLYKMHSDNAKIALFIEKMNNAIFFINYTGR